VCGAVFGGFFSEKDWVSWDFFGFLGILREKDWMLRGLYGFSCFES
jgi:hypothetical protein